MLSIICIILPFVICTFFTLLFSARNEKTVTDKVLLALSACASVYFFAEANYLTLYEDYKTWVLADIASQYARPLVAPLMVLCLHSMIGVLRWRWWMTLAFTLAIMIGTVSMCIYLIMGIDNAASYIDKIDAADGVVDMYESRIHWLYQIFCVWMYRITNVVYAFVGVLYIAHLVRATKFRPSEIPNFLFRGGEIEPAFLMSILYITMLCTILMKMAVGKYFLIDHQGCTSIFCIVRTMLVFFIGHIGLRNREATVTMDSLRGTTIDGRLVDNATRGIEQDHITDSGKMVVNYVDMCDEECVDVECFKDIEEKKMYLDPHVTIESVASAIGTNRTYLSKYITDKFGITFREYINSLRIEYAKEYMKKNPTHKQEVVAEECGFADAPQFNKKFKQIVGKSPRMWLMMER